MTRDGLLCLAKCIPMSLKFSHFINMSRLNIDEFILVKLKKNRLFLKLFTNRNLKRFPSHN